LISHFFFGTTPGEDFLPLQEDRLLIATSSSHPSRHYSR
jgi:hypothetical protein